MKIGQLAKLTTLSVDTIRYYEQRGILPKAVRAENGYRSYSQEDAKLLRFIVHVKSLGFTLEEAKTLITLRTGKADCKTMKKLALSKAEDMKKKIEKLAEMQQSLEKLADECDKTGNNSYCPILTYFERETDE